VESWLGIQPRRRTSSVARGLEARVGAGGGQGDAEGGAAARSALDGDVAGVLLHDAIGDGEAEPRAAPDTLRREERIVDACDVLGRDADAVVRDFDRERVAPGGGRGA